jgi:hypothetical protein
VITKFKGVLLPTGEELTYYRSDGGTYTIDVQFEPRGPIVATSTTGSFEAALFALSERFKLLGGQLDTLAKDKLLGAQLDTLAKERP